MHGDEWEGDVPAVSNGRRRGRFPSGLRRRGDLSPASSMQLRGGGRRCSSLSPQGGSGGSRFLCTATNGKGTFRLFPMRGGERVRFSLALREAGLRLLLYRRGSRRFCFLMLRGRSGGRRFLCTATNGKGTFRLFPMHGGWLTAYRAVNIAAAHWKFARKLARPPSWFHVTWARSGRFRPYCFPVRAGWGYGRRLWAIRGVPARFGRVLG